MSPFAVARVRSPAPRLKIALDDYAWKCAAVRTP
jgi:hypothetical protein